VGVGIQLAGEKQLHDHIISLRREVCAHQTDLTLPHFIKVSAPSLASERLLLNANSAIFQLYHGENKLIVNEMIMGSTLY
jgi:hypothetical protein